MAPFSRCVSCSGTSRRAKLLKCLHSLCVGCLPKQLTNLNGVICPTCGSMTPPSSSGKPQSMALPDSYATANKQSGGAPDAQLEIEAVQHCDECFENEKAVSTCMDCKAVLCDFHTQGHSRSRSSHNHKVRPIAQDASTPESVNSDTQQLERMHCIIHPTRKLEQFCTTCKEFFCEQCLYRGGSCKVGSADSSHSLLPMKEAADKMRGGVEKLLTDSASHHHGNVVLKAIENLKVAIDQLHDRTEAVSEEVVAYFVDVVKLIKLREAEVLERLDSLRSAKLIPLEQQKSRLEKSLSSHETVSMLLESCDDNYDLIRMSGWLEEAASAANESARSDVKPCVESKLVFRNLYSEQLTTAIACVGNVFDAADIDLRESSIQCQPSLHVGEEIRITLKAVSENGSSDQVNEVCMTSLEVEVMSPDNEVMPCNANKDDEDGGIIVARYQPTQPGKHQVMARYDGHHFSGSPADVMVTTHVRRFDPTRCHGDIQLSNNNMTARHTQVRVSRSVCGADIYRSGTVEIGIRLDNMPYSEVMIFLCSSTNPQLDTYQQDNMAHGWYGCSNYTGNWHGTQLGQPWQTGDIIRLSLDCDRHTLTGRHERTGATQTLTNVTGDLYLYVSLYFQGDQVTIL